MRQSRRDMEKNEIARVLIERMRSDRGRADHRRLVERGYQALLEAELGAVFPRTSADRVLSAVLNSDRLADLVRPSAGAILSEVVAEMKRDARPLSRFVPKEAEDAIERIAARPGLVDPRWIRAIFQEKAVEAIVADTLYSAIRDFSTVLPRFFLGLLPTRGLGVLGTAAGLGGKIMEEVEKRIEPEIRSFLVGGTKRALDRAADFAVAHADDKTSLELRRNLVHFVLKESPAFHARPLEAPVLAEVSVSAEAIARRVGESEEIKERAAELLDRFYAAHGARPVRELLTALGVKLEPDLDVIAEATWGLLDLFLQTEAVRGFVEERVAEVLELSAQG